MTSAIHCRRLFLLATLVIVGIASRTNAQVPGFAESNGDVSTTAPTNRIRVTDGDISSGTLIVSATVDPSQDKPANEQGKTSAAPTNDASSTKKSTKSDSYESKLEKLQEQVDKLTEAEKERKDKASKLPTSKITAQLQSDFYWFGQDSTSRAAVGDLQDGSDFRRARIGLTGDYGPTQYRIEFDWAQTNRPNFQDVWMGLTDVNGIDTLRIGHQFEPFSLERNTSNRFQVFLERSIVDSAFAPSRNLGLLAQDEMKDELGYWAIGVFRTNSDNFGDDAGDFGEYSVTGRATRLLWYDDSADSLSMLHFGGAYSYRDADNRIARFRSQPEARLGAIAAGNVPAFVDTGDIRTNYFQLFGLETAWVEGPFSMQAEYVWAPVDTIRGPTALMQGWYCQSSLFLTGEHRPFRKSTAVFDRVIPRSDFVPYGKGRPAQGPVLWRLVRGCRTLISTTPSSAAERSRI